MKTDENIDLKLCLSTHFNQYIMMTFLVFVWFCFNIAWNLRYQNKKKIDGIKFAHYMDYVLWAYTGNRKWWIKLYPKTNVITC